MRTHLALSVVAVVALSVLCGCSSGAGKSWSMASLNPFQSSPEALANTTAPKFKKPSALANPADSLPSASEYASTSGKSTLASGAHSQQPTAGSGYNDVAQTGYQSGQSSYSPTAPSSSAGYNALPGSSPTVSPQRGYYNSPADYSTASRSNSPTPGYSHGGTNSPPAARADSGSRFAAGAQRWGGNGSTPSGYNYPRVEAAGAKSSYTSPSSSASPWSATSQTPTGLTSNGSSPSGGGTGAYSPAPFADRYSSNAGYLSEKTTGSSFRDRYASAYTGSSSSGNNYKSDSTKPSPATEPAAAFGKRAAYIPGQTGYDAGNTGYKPPGTSPYQPPTGNYTTPGYSPGSIDRYRSDKSSGLRPMGSYPSSSGSQSGSSGGYKLPLSG